MCEISTESIVAVMNGLSLIAFVVAAAWAVRGACGK